MLLSVRLTGLSGPRVVATPVTTAPCVSAATAPVVMALSVVVATNNYGITSPPPLAPMGVDNSSLVNAPDSAPPLLRLCADNAGTGGAAPGGVRLTLALC